jgi:hypothetical protein
MRGEAGTARKVPQSWLFVLLRLHPPSESSGILSTRGRYTGNSRVRDRGSRSSLFRRGHHYPDLTKGLRFSKKTSTHLLSTNREFKTQATEQDTRRTMKREIQALKKMVASMKSKTTKAKTVKKIESIQLIRTTNPYRSQQSQWN